jgi:hypothetical protein
LVTTATWTEIAAANAARIRQIRDLVEAVLADEHSDRQYALEIILALTESRPTP